MPGKHIRLITMPWDELQGSTKRGYRVSIMEAIRVFLELMAPGQSSSLWEHISNFPIDSQSTTTKTGDVLCLSKVMVKSIQDAPTPIIRSQILSLVANDYKKRELMNAVPGVTQWEIDMARKHSRMYGPGVLPSINPSPRESMSMEKGEHFMIFMMQPQYMQVWITYIILNSSMYPNGQYICCFWPNVQYAGN